MARTPWERGSLTVGTAVTSDSATGLMSLYKNGALVSGSGAVPTATVTAPVTDATVSIGSFGASAVLIYGVPKSPYAQPRNLVFGHSISAAVGVTCALFLESNTALSAALAVSLAIVLMHLTRSIHPPGGATALIAVIGSEHIHQMSYWYVFSPVLAGAVIMLVVALLVNNISSHRRYPEYWL